MLPAVLAFFGTVGPFYPDRARRGKTRSPLFAANKISLCRSCASLDSF